MAAVGQAEVAELWARLGQPDHTVVLDVAATLDVDFSQVRAAAGQVHQAFVVNVDAAYVWGKNVVKSYCKCIFLKELFFIFKPK